MAQTLDTPQAPAPANLVSRFVGVLFSPRQTYQGIVATPRWLGMLLLIAVFLCLATFLFLSTQVGRDALLEQQVSAMEAFGVNVSDEMYAQLEGRLAFAQYTGAAGQLVTLPIVYLIMAGILFAIFNAAMGGEASFKQVFTVVVHSGAVSVVQQLFVLPLNYFRGSLSSPTNVAAMLPMLPEKSFVTYLLGTIDIFLIWWLMVLAIGLAVLYRRRTQPVAVTLFVIYAVIALCIAGVRSWMGGS
jgi:hypothetical protein